VLVKAGYARINKLPGTIGKASALLITPNSSLAAATIRQFRLIANV
jgi:hypothetical protein